jgi:hypothetical protein
MTSDIKVRSRLTSLLDVLEHERGTLEDTGNTRLAERAQGVSRT